MRVLALPLIVFALVLSACTSFHPVPKQDAPTTLEADDRVRVTTMNGIEHTFRVQRVDHEGVTGPERTFAYDDLMQIERERFDWMRSLGIYLIAGLVLLIDQHG